MLSHRSTIRNLLASGSINEDIFLFHGYMKLKFHNNMNLFHIYIYLQFHIIIHTCRYMHLYSHFQH